MERSAKCHLKFVFLMFVWTVFGVSCSVANTVDIRNPRFNNITKGRLMKLGGNTVQTIRSSHGNNHMVGITNGKATGIGGVLGAKETKALGNNLRQGLRKVLPFGNNASSKTKRVSSVGTNSIRTNNLNSRKTQGNVMRKSTSTRRTSNTVNGRANTGNNIQRQFAGQSNSGSRGRLNNAMSKKAVGTSHSRSRTGTRVQHQQVSRGSSTNSPSKTQTSNVAVQGKNTVRGSAPGKVRHNINKVSQNTRQVRGQSLSARRGSTNSRGGSVISTKGRSGTARSASGRIMASPGSSNSRISSVSTGMNQNGVSRNNNVVKSKGGFARKRISDGSMVRNTGNINRSNSQSGRHTQRSSAGHNRMSRISQRGGGGHHPFQVSSGMQSNIRRRVGGIPRGISNNGKRVVVQNGRRIIVSPSRYSLNRQRQNSNKQQAERQIRIMGDAMEGGLENMDIDNIIGLASKIATVKLANSVISSFHGQEGTPQLSRFLINSELDIVPEMIVQAPRQPERVSTRRIVTITQPAQAVKQLPAPQVAANQVTVASGGYGTPVLVRSNGDIQFSRVDQTGKEISSVTISNGKSRQTKKGKNVKKVNTKSKVKHGNGTGSSVAGGTSKQVPEGELEMEMETEGLSTTTLAATTKTTKPLLPPTTTVANSVIVT